MILFIPEKLTVKEKKFWIKVLLDEVDEIKTIKASLRSKEQNTHKNACDKKLRELGVKRKKETK